jgi:three-Cys-motif partner protein
LDAPSLPQPQDDGLLIDDVGEWATHKHHYLRRFVHAFLVAMKKKKWSGLHYIDLFAGPGILRLEDSRKLEWGSPLIAAQTVGFSALHLCEKRPKAFQSLQSRIEKLHQRPEVFWHQGDANQVVAQVAENVPPRSLSLAFLDPYGLHLEFESLRVLAKHRVDLIIFFPDHLDALRNCHYVYHEQPDSNLDRYLGKGASWRTALDNAPQRNWAEVLRKLYEENIRGLGYSHFEHKRINGKVGPLYQLIYCSHHPAGTKIWRGIASTEPDGQRTLPFSAPPEG